MKTLWTTLLILLLAGGVEAQTAPTPAYNLPEQGTIMDWSTGTVTHYWDHGRSYNSYGGNNASQRDDNRGHITRYGSQVEENPVGNTLQEIDQFNRYMGYK